MLEIKNKKLSIRQQYKLLSLNRLGVYCKEANNFNADKVLMRKIDEIYINCPFYSYRRIRAIFKCNAHLVNFKRVFRLIKQIDLMAIFPKPNLLKANKEHKISPYLLRERAIDKVNEVWSTGHHLYSDATAFSNWPAIMVAQSLCAELALVKHFRYVILS